MTGQTETLSAWDVAALEVAIRRMKDHGDLEEHSADTLLSKLAKANKIRVVYPKEC